MVRRCRVRGDGNVPTPPRHHHSSAAGGMAVTRESPMDVDVAGGIAEAVRGVVPNVAFAVETGDRYGHDPHYRSKFELPPDVVVAHLDELLDRPILKLLARHTTMPTGELLD